MACKECMERREKLIDAVLEGRLSAAASHLVKGVSEMAGITPKAPVEPIDGIQDEDGKPQTVETDTSFVKPKKPRAKRS